MSIRKRDYGISCNRWLGFLRVDAAAGLLANPRDITGLFLRKNKEAWLGWWLNHHFIKLMCVLVHGFVSAEVCVHRLKLNFAIQDTRLRLWAMRTGQVPEQALEYVGSHSGRFHMAS